MPLSAFSAIPPPTLHMSATRWQHKPRKEGFSQRAQFKKPVSLSLGDFVQAQAMPARGREWAEGVVLFYQCKRKVCKPLKVGTRSCKRAAGFRCVAAIESKAAGGGKMGDGGESFSGRKPEPRQYPLGTASRSQSPLELRTHPSDLTSRRPNVDLA